ncbi:MAG: 30S ribosomal protein S2 [Candidatus Nitrosocaldus sp.]
MSMIENIDKLILSTGIRIGTNVKTKYMEQFIAKANEGVYMLDMSKTLERIDAAASFISRSLPKVVVCSTKDNAKTAVFKFCELTGATPMIGRFMPGTLTNPFLSMYIEPEVVLVSDPQADLQAVIEATNAGVPVIAIANTDNFASNVDLIIPANNRGRRAIAAVYWLLTLEVLSKKGLIEQRQFDTFIYKGSIYKVDDFETKLEEEGAEEQG